MKKYITFLSVFLFAVSFSAAQQSGIFSFTPQKPKPGDEITINFNSGITKLEAGKNINAIIYSVKEKSYYCEEYPMIKTKSGWTYKYIIPDTAWSIGIKFTNGNEEVDDEGSPFPVFLYNKNGKLFPGTRASYAQLCFNTNAKKDGKKLYSLFKEEFNENPTLVKIFLFGYANSITMVEKENSKKIVSEILEKIEKEEELDYDLISAICSIYYGIVPNKEKLRYYLDLRILKYPLSTIAQFLAHGRLQSNYTANKNIDSLELGVAEFYVRYGKDNVVASSLIANLLFSAYCEQKLYSKAKEFWENSIVTQEKISSRISNTTESAKNVFRIGDNNSFAKELIDYALKLLPDYKIDKKEFPSLTNAQIKKEVDRKRCEVIYNAALIYQKIEGNEKALKLLESAYGYGNPSPEIKLLHAEILLESEQDNVKALRLTEELIESGKSSIELIELNTKLYQIVRGTDNDYEKYLSDLKKGITGKLSEEIQEGMINKPAQNFTLFDLDGKEVKLSDYKGKVVILDFWATWCGPCKASFPYMKKAVQKYSGNSNVKFLFIDTFERVGNKTENAKKFITENNYPFHVLSDSDSEVAHSFGVEAIPTKIFIDKDGNQRYYTVGGGTDKLNDEIEILIKLLSN